MIRGPWRSKAFWKEAPRRSRAACFSARGRGSSARRIFLPVGESALAARFLPGLEERLRETCRGDWSSSPAAARAAASRSAWPRSRPSLRRASPPRSWTWTEPGPSGRGRGRRGSGASPLGAPAPRQGGARRVGDASRRRLPARRRGPRPLSPRRPLRARRRVAPPGARRAVAVLLLLLTPWRMSGIAADAVVSAAASPPHWSGYGKSPRLLTALTSRLTLEKLARATPAISQSLTLSVPGSLPLSLWERGGVRAPLFTAKFL